MPISYISGTAAAQAAAVTSPHTFTHGVSSTNEFLVVSFGVKTVASTGTAVTYSGVSLTKLSELTNGTASRYEIWYLKNPPTGNNTVSISTLAATKLAGSAISYGGVNTSTPWGAATSGLAATNNSTPNLNLTTTVANSWIHNFFEWGSSTPNWTSGTNNIVRIIDESTGNPNGSNADTVTSNLITSTGIGTYNVSGTLSAAIQWVGFAGELVPQPTAFAQGYVLKAFK